MLEPINKCVDVPIYDVPSSIDSPSIDSLSIARRSRLLINVLRVEKTNVFCSQLLDVDRGDVIVVLLLLLKVLWLSFLLFT